eukprot:GFUD01136648.1.p1 GENE.GFUD01136648.1~~GFUD01136648.1.p1  ORF type:complete len:143 (+),score=21.22 GFUD01136648.1:61-489(+)
MPAKSATAMAPTPALVTGDSSTKQKSKATNMTSKNPGLVFNCYSLKRRMKAARVGRFIARVGRFIARCWRGTRDAPLSPGEEGPGHLQGVEQAEPQQDSDGSQRVGGDGSSGRECTGLYNENSPLLYLVGNRCKFVVSILCF